ncbi:spermine oxidase-like isoform X2 [Copidosoma floridanum]|nr:spermine oxidase-like isoform X2 [Copidosoma floridanum]
MTDPKVLIIGAGAAGIAAASRLLDRGLKNLVILEAKDRIGGRVHTVKFSDNVVELGAQWCHGEVNNIVYKLASKHNLLASSKNINDHTKHIFVNSLGEVLSQQETVEILRIYEKICDEEDEVDVEPGTSYGDYFTRVFYKEIDNNPLITKETAEQVLDWMHKYHNSIDCCDSWHKVSFARLKDYWTCEGDQLLNWKTNGYSKIFDLLVKRYPDPSKELPVFNKILFNKEVQLVDYTKNHVTVTTSDGSMYKVSNVIFTPSLGVLKEQHTTLFKPSLPERKIQAIKGLNIGVANKIFLEFPYRWWPENTGAFSLMWSDEQKKNFLKINGKDRFWLCDVFQFFTVDCQPRLLSGWIVGPNAKYIETLSDDTVLKEFYFLLQKFMGHIYDIPKPQSILRSKWYSDKHIRGSYSYRSLDTEISKINSQDYADPIKAANNNPIILFAGEATHPHYYSTVHGAVETGFREADRLLEYYGCLKPRL